MFRFWRREKSIQIGQPVTLRCRAHQALLLWQWEPGRWVLAIDPEAPVDHQELLQTLDRAEAYDLAKYHYQDKQEAAYHIKQAYR